MHALTHLFQRFFRTCRLVFGANTCGNIAVQVEPAQKRRMTINMASLKRLELRHAFGVFRQNTWKVHELRKTNHLGVVSKRQQIIDQKLGARRFHMGRGHTA